MINHSLGTLFIVAAPSGGGKTSLVKALVHSIDSIDVSISHTTRPKRPNEQHGVDYFFIDNAAFLAMIAAGAFLEHACVFHHYYGTSFEQIESRLQAGIDVVLDIDWQGAEQIQKQMPHSVSIFIIPPSINALQERLQGRGQDDEAIIQYRMQQAQDEISHYTSFDYLIVNDAFDTAARELQSIILTHRLSMSKQSVHQRALLASLLAGHERS